MNRAVVGSLALRLWLAAAALAAGVATPEVRGIPEVADLHGIARVAGRPAANVVVWLDAPNAPRPARPPKAVLDQRNLSFSPRVLAVRVGSTVDFPNNDRVFHNVFSFRDGKRFNLGMYPVGTKGSVTFDQPGLSRIFCNIHPNMAAYVLALDTPYFGVSDQFGVFNLRSVPLDRHTYHAWRAGAPELTGVWAPAAPGNSDADLIIDWPS